MGNSVAFGYRFNQLDRLFNKKEELISRVEKYCQETNKDIDVTVFICEDSHFILELKITKNNG